MTSFSSPVCDDGRDATSFDWYFSIFLTKSKSYMWTIRKKSLVIRVLFIWKTKGEKIHFFFSIDSTPASTGPVLSMGVIHMFRSGLWANPYRFFLRTVGFQEFFAILKRLWAVIWTKNESIWWSSSSSIYGCGL